MVIKDGRIKEVDEKEIVSGMEIPPWQQETVLLFLILQLALNHPLPATLLLNSAYLKPEAAEQVV